MKKALSLLAAFAAAAFLTACTPVAPQPSSAETPASATPSLSSELPSQVLGPPEATATPAPTAAPTPEPSPEPVTITLRAVGDIMVHEAQQISALTEDGGYDFSEYFAVIAPELSCADVTVGNLETPVASGAPSGFPSFNAPAELLAELKNAGFDCFTLANNHILDQKAAGLEETAANLEALDLDYFGASPGENKVLLLDVKGLRLAFLGYTTGLNGHSDTKDQVRLLTEENVAQDVAYAKAQGADYIVAFPHWGAEYYEGVHSSTAVWAQKLADAGVDAILGSHPHVVEPMGQVTAQDGRVVPVVHSMGNFISNQQTHPRYLGLIVELTLTKASDGAVTLDRLGYIPTFVYKYNGKAKYCYEVLPVDYALMDQRITGSAATKLKNAHSYAQKTLESDLAVRLSLLDQ